MKGGGDFKIDIGFLYLYNTEQGPSNVPSKTITIGQYRQFTS